MCKSVCKEWYRLISNPSYVEQHFCVAQPYPLIRAIGYERVSRILYLVEFPEMGTSCVYDWEMRGLNEGNHKILKLQSKLKVPLRNAESVLNTEVVAESGVHVKKRISTRPKDTFDHYFKLVNSCNGFICLAEPTINNPVVVCNPVTGEFVDLTAASTADMNALREVYCGFGFDRKRDEYKVIRILIPKVGLPEQELLEPIRSVLTDKIVFSANVAEVLTLGLGSWKNIGYAPFVCYRMYYPTYLNGTLHWILELSGRFYLPCFDFNTEKFHSIPLPQGLQEIISYEIGAKISLGVLGGCLCVCDTCSMKSLHIWVMKEAGAVGSWTQDFSIDISSDGPPRLPCGLYMPLDLLMNGAILLFHEDKGALISYHPEKQWLTKYMEIQGIKAELQAIVHIPSFTSLKEALKGNEVQVHNIASRCGKYKLFEEVNDHFLVEDERYFTSQDPQNSRTGDPQNSRTGDPQNSPTGDPPLQ